MGLGVHIPDQECSIIMMMSLQVVVANCLRYIVLALQHGVFVVCHKMQDAVLSWSVVKCRLFIALTLTLQLSIWPGSAGLLA